MKSHPQAVIFQWNCRSIFTNLHYLVQHLSTAPKYHLLVLQSLNVTENKLPKLSGYDYPPVIPKEHNEGKISTAIYIQENLNYSQIHPPIPRDTLNINACAARVKLNDAITLNVVSIYLPKGPDDKNTEWLRSLQDQNEKWLVAGDFNAHSTFWDRDCKDVIHHERHFRTS